MGYASFEDLEIWKKAHELRVKIFELTRDCFKNDQDLLRQLRRAAHSVSANIAEGHGVFHYLQNIEHLRRARGSCEEVKDGLIAARDFKYIEENNQQMLNREYNGLVNGINAYIRYLLDRKSESK